jgi:hypothetical protein
VRTQTDGGKTYDVIIDAGYGLLKCTCHTWCWMCLPCKHIFSVLQYYSSWESLPSKFRNSSFFTLDLEVVNVLPASQYEDGDIEEFDILTLITCPWLTNQLS